MITDIWKSGDRRVYRRLVRICDVSSYYVPFVPDRTLQTWLVLVVEAHELLPGSHRGLWLIVGQSSISIRSIGNGDRIYCTAIA